MIHTTLYDGGEKVYDLRTEGEQINLLLHEGRTIYVRDAATNCSLAYRVVEEDGPNGLEKWFDVGVPWTPKFGDLVGSAESGWTGLNGFFRLTLEWSETLTSWALAQFRTIPGDPEVVIYEGETFHLYWGRSNFPVDSQIKSAAMTCEQINGDPRNNPIIAMVLNDETVVLPRSEYWMPGDAESLQEDLDANGWPGVVVTASSATTWKITLPEDTQMGYYAQWKVYWPVYYVADMYGDVVNPVDGRSFTGTFQNAPGVMTAKPRQFGRLSIDRLKL